MATKIEDVKIGDMVKRVPFSLGQSLKVVSITMRLKRNKYERTRYILEFDKNGLPFRWELKSGSKVELDNPINLTEMGFNY